MLQVCEPASNAGWSGERAAPRAEQQPSAGCAQRPAKRSASPGSPATVRAVGQQSRSRACCGVVAHAQCGVVRRAGCASPASRSFLGLYINSCCASPVSPATVLRQAAQQRTFEPGAAKPGTAQGSAPRQAAQQRTVARRATVPRSRPTARPSGNKAAVEQSQAVLRREAAEAAKVGRRSRPTALRRARPSGDRAAALDDPARSGSRAQSSVPSPAGQSGQAVLRREAAERHSSNSMASRVPYLSSRTSRLAPCCPRRPRPLSRRARPSGAAQNGGVRSVSSVFLRLSASVCPVLPCSADRRAGASAPALSEGLV